MADNFGPASSNIIPFAPRRLILDASVVIKWYVIEDRRPEARVLERFKNTLAAPDFLAIELANIAWKKARRREIDPSHAAMIATPEALERVHLIPSTPIAPHAYALAAELDHPVYDCLYLACALQVDGLVITADDRFARAVETSSHATRVRRLGAPLPGQGGA